jgi:hypothetical protein
MAGGENKTIPIDPVGIIGVDAKRVPEENSPDLGGAQRETQMTGTACVNGVDG